MIVGTLLTTKEATELRTADDCTLIALYNVETMGQSCLRVGDVARSDEIYGVIVDELKDRGIAYDGGALIG